MPYQFPFFPKYFKDNLEYSEQIKDQAAQCRKALNFGTATEIANTIKTYELLVTKKMIPKDDPYEDALDELNDDLEKYYASLEKDYQERVKKALCSSVIRKPDKRKAPRWFHEAKFQILNEFFDRLGLGLQHEQTGHW